MSVKSILRLGDPTLRRVAEPASEPTAPDIQALIQDLTDTLAEAGGIGIAAPQIGVSRRVLLFSVPEARATDDPDDGAWPLTALINPVLEPIGDDRAIAWEGCLSIPGMRGEIARWQRVRVTGSMADGQPWEAVVAGWRARVLQHEIDHLDGVLYIDRLDDPTRFGFTEEVIEAEAAARYDDRQESRA
ncbi:MAG: peptide deformylase [Alphaproteobacteria bacterium]|nr:peptide deformylase [Alphaproteobacteria bacterium]